MRHHLHRTRYLLWGFVLFFAAIGFPAYGQKIGSLRGEFADPPKEVRPLVRWWWPGGDVTLDELRREIRVLDEAGFAGAEVQPFRGELRADMSTDVLARVNDYPTPSFWRKVRAAAEEARRPALGFSLCWLCLEQNRSLK